MKPFESLNKILLKIVSLFCLLYFCLLGIHYLCVYKDAVLSIGAKKGIEGKIVYLEAGPNIKAVEFPLGIKKNMYIAPERGKTGYLGYVSDFSFSSDGKKVVFIKLEYLAGKYRNVLYVMSSDGTNLRRFLDLNDSNLEIFCPSWSPDGRYIALVVHKPHKQGGIYVIDANNPYAYFREVIDIRPARSKPHWTPDSIKITFISDEYSRKVINEKWHYEIFTGKEFIVKVDGSELKPFIVSDSVFWSPDGKKFVTKDEKGYYINNIDGADKRLIIPYRPPAINKIFGGFSYLATWSPDGKHIAFVKEIWPGLCGIGIYVISVDNPKRQIRIATEFKAIKDIIWVK